MARVAVVTGGTRGIGRAIAAALKDKGYKVAANYGSDDKNAAQFGEPLAERLGYRVVGVIAERIAPPQRVRRWRRVLQLMAQPAQRADVVVPDPGLSEILRQRVGVELRVCARARHRMHINDEIVSGLTQQHDQLGDGSR